MQLCITQNCSPNRRLKTRNWSQIGIPCGNVSELTKKFPNIPTYYHSFYPRPLPTCGFTKWKILKGLVDPATPQTTSTTFTNSGWSWFTINIHLHPDLRGHFIWTTVCLGFVRSCEFVMPLPKSPSQYKKWVLLGNDLEEMPLHWWIPSFHKGMVLSCQ